MWTVLLEREAEFARLGSCSIVHWPVTAVVTIEGPAGIGKTPLLGAASELAAGRGFCLLAARGREQLLALPGNLQDMAEGSRPRRRHGN
jgi:hypothetical protein